MAVNTLRAKNQVTLPSEVVTRAGLHAGDPLSFTVENGKIVIEMFVGRRASKDWITDEVAAEIDAAAQETPGAGYDSADDMIAALRRG